MGLLTLSRTYPIVTVIIGLILFIIGFKTAKKLFWALALIAIITAIIMMFL